MLALSGGGAIQIMLPDSLCRVGPRQASDHAIQERKISRNFALRCTFSHLKCTFRASRVRAVVRAGGPRRAECGESESARGRVCRGRVEGIPSISPRRTRRHTKKYEEVRRAKSVIAYLASSVLMAMVANRPRTTNRTSIVFLRATS